MEGYTLFQGYFVTVNKLHKNLIVMADDDKKRPDSISGGGGKSSDTTGQKPKKYTSYNNQTGAKYTSYSFASSSNS